MPHSQIQPAPGIPSALFGFADKTAELERCESQINQLIERLARGGPERLEAHRQIGEALLRAKEIVPNNFVKWSDETFGRGPQWRATHMTVARRWDDITEARTWAEGEGSKLATLYSVDGALELLDAWAAATGHESSKPKRSLPKKAKTSAADLCRKQSADEREIAALRQQLQEQSDEAAHFRLQLPVDIRSEARALAVRACALDAQAERQLRDIAREHRWLFRSLCDDLGGDRSGGPDCAAQHSSLQAPIVDEQSAAGAISETFADAPKPEESSSDEMGAPGGQGNGDASGSGVPQVAARDNPGASPPLADERPQRGQGANQGTLHMRPGFVPPHRTLMPTSQTMDRSKAVVVENVRRGKKRRQVDRWWEREPDRPTPLARDVGKIPR
jgi:hypothetical protein